MIGVLAIFDTLLHVHFKLDTPTAMGFSIETHTIET